MVGDTGCVYPVLGRKGCLSPCSQIPLEIPAWLPKSSQIAPKPGRMEAGAATTLGTNKTDQNPPKLYNKLYSRHGSFPFLVTDL